MVEQQEQIVTLLTQLVKPNQEQPIAPQQTPISPQPPITPQQTPITPQQTPITPQQTPITPQQTPISPQPPITPQQTPITPQQTPISPQQTPQQTPITPQQTPITPQPPITPQQTPISPQPPITPQHAVQTPRQTPITPQQTPIIPQPPITPQQTPIIPQPPITPQQTLIIPQQSFRNDWQPQPQCSYNPSYNIEPANPSYQTDYSPYDTGTNSYYESDNQLQDFFDLTDSLDDSDYGSRENTSSQSAAEESFLPPQNVPPPPFETPPKLKPIDRVMKYYKGNDTATLRLLTVALARDCIFGREVLVKRSVGGRQGYDQLDPEKMEYIKALIRSRVPKKPKIEFEHIWGLCRTSLGKSCQGLRMSAKKKQLMM